MQDRDKYTIVHSDVPSNTLALFGYQFEGTDYAERKIWLRLLHSFELNRGTGSGDIDSAEAPPLRRARTEDPGAPPSFQCLLLWMIQLSLVKMQILWINLVGLWNGEAMF